MRAVIRFAGFAALCALFYAVRSLQRLLLCRFPKADRACRDRLLRAWARLTARVLGMRASVSGPVPEPPFLLVTNHLSYVDILLLSGLVRATFVSKREVGDWPFIGPSIKLYDVIFVDRTNPKSILRVNEEFRTRIARGEGIVLFPEGTSSNGQTVLPLKPSLLQWAAESQFPVHYATILYRTPPGSPPAADAVCWWGDMTFPPHFKGLLRIPWFEAVVTFAPEPVQADDRKRLASALHERLHRQFHLPTLVEEGVPS